MGRHRDMDYFETRALALEHEQRKRYAANPPKDDDLRRHLRELEASDLIQNFRLISATYHKD